MNEVDQLISIVYESFLPSCYYMWLEGEFPPGVSFRSAALVCCNFPRFKKQPTRVQELVIDHAITEFVKLKSMGVI